MSRRRVGDDDLIVEESGEHTIGRHVRMAHAILKGEHQIAEYVAPLEIGECARILAAAPESLPLLAPRRDDWGALRESE